MVLYSLALEAITALMVLIPVYMVLNHICIYNGKQTLLYGLFSWYLCVVYALVGLPNVTYIRFELHGNLIPFAGMVKGLRSTVLNVILFLPLGVMLPLIWKKYRKLKATLTFGFFLSVLIEMLQIFTYRATDINDLITNTLGTFLGYRMADGLIRRHSAPIGIIPERKNWGLALSCGVTAAVMFFAHPVLLALLWKLI